MHHFLDQVEENLDVNTRTIISRDRVAAYEFSVCNYFVDDCLYDHMPFKRHFHLSTQLFVHIAMIGRELQNL